MIFLVSRNAALTAFLVVVPVLVALAGSRYEQRIMTVAGIYAIAVLGYQLIFGRIGGLSLAQGCFFGLGAYATGLVSTGAGLGFPATLAVSVLVPSAIAVVVAVPVLRLESHYFALATLGIAQIVLLIAINWTSVTGGANGLYGVPAIRLPDGEAVSSDVLLVLVWSLLGLVVLLVSIVFRGRLAARLTVLREAPNAAAASAIDIGACRLVLFTGSAALGGAAGALQAHSIGVVSPAVTDFHIMVTILAMTVIGGRGHPAGAIVGAVLLVHLPEWFRFLETNYLIAYGGALLAAVIMMPNGIVGLLERWLQVRPVPGPVDDHRIRVRAGAAAALEIEDLSRQYGGVLALDRVSLSVDPGEIVGLIGPNGSGKSTLINVVSGLQRPHGGRVRLGRRDIGRAPAHSIARAGLARTFQTPVLPANLTAFEIVLAATHGRNSTGSAEQHALICLTIAGLSGLADRPAGSLSPAELRRLDLARALGTTPAILLLDEPAAGLTQGERDALAELLRRLAAAGIGLLVVDHTMDFLLPLADRVCCLATGRIVAAGSPRDVTTDPRAIAAYFGTSTP